MTRITAIGVNSHGGAVFSLCDALALLLTKFCGCQLTEAVFAGNKGERSAVVPLHVELTDVIDRLNSSSRSRGNGSPRIFHTQEHHSCTGRIVLFVSLRLPTKALPFIHLCSSSYFTVFLDILFFAVNQAIWHHLQNEYLCFFASFTPKNNCFLSIIREKRFQPHFG